MKTPLPPDRIDLLLGGYATGTLTPDEHQALMQAALSNQALFDALMDEEALRETLSDPQTRADLLRALRPVETQPSWWRRPWPWAALATATAAVSLFVLLRTQPLQEVAKVNAPQEPAREIAANLPKPEPVPTDIATPKSLRIAEPSKQLAQPVKSKDTTVPKQLDDKRDARNELGEEKAAAPAAELGRNKMAQSQVVGGVAPAAPAVAALAPPPTASPPPASPPRAAKQESASAFRAEADEALAKKEAAQVVLDIKLAVQREDGTWLDRAAGVTLPAGRPVRLTVTSPAAGAVSLAPPLVAPVAVESGVPVHVVLPGQRAGELALRIDFSPAAVARGNNAMGLRSARARADAVDSTVVPLRATEGRAAAVAVRELRLKFE